ncbi:hypothetical protein OG749_36465 [Streptomyces nojiriensis]|uniref:hypothetical protein n=1 Tax=Streptomyces nojiriensis TaxID=66374 RepID=UPI002E189C18
MIRHQNLISFGGGATAEGCAVAGCSRPLLGPPFATDREAVEHVATHDVADLAWALLEYKAIIAGLLDLVDEKDADELLTDVGDAVVRSRHQHG